MNKIDARLRRYDAAPNAALTPEESMHADNLLTQIISDRLTVSAARTENATPARGSREDARHRNRRPLTLSLAGVAAAAVAGVLVSTNLGTGATGHGIATGSTGQASAIGSPSVLAGQHLITKAQLDSWMSAPADDSAAAKAGAACLTGSKDPGDAKVFAVDQRGTALALLAEDPATQQIWWCMNTPAGIALSGFVTAPDLPARQAGPGAVNLLSLAGFGEKGFGLGFGYGRAGAGVTSVTLNVPSRGHYTAAVQDGYWEVWWPQPSSVPDDLNGVTVTWKTADGATHSAGQQNLTAYWTSRSKAETLALEKKFAEIMSGPR
jgi:hypothetical protein